MAIASLAIVTAVAFAELSVRFASGVFNGSTQYARRVIVIDAGHGGFDPGALSNGINEKDINLEMALAMRDYFTVCGYCVVMTRSADASTEDEGLNSVSERKSSDIRNRVALAESFADSVLICVHQNAYSDTSQWGAQTFYGLQEPTSQLLAECILSSVISSLQPDNRRLCKPAEQRIYITRTASCPTVLLECGFMTNETELARLCSEEYRSNFALCTALGYCDYEIQRE